MDHLIEEADRLVRQGRGTAALERYVAAAVRAEREGRHADARGVWEQIGNRFGATSVVLERLASVSERVASWEDAFDYWLAAAARHHRDGELSDAGRTRSRAVGLRERVVVRSKSRLPPKLALASLIQGDGFVRDLLA